MHALVTGGGGFLGLYVVEQLLARGDRVRVLCRGDYPRLRELGVEVVRGDVRDATLMQSACQGIDTVFHTAAVPGIWGPWKLFYETNTLGTQNVIAACQTQGVQRLIHTSSPSVIYNGQEHVDADESLPYPTRFNCHYPHSKALAEQAVLAANGQHGLTTCALRPHLIWGPRDNHLLPRLIERARSGRLRQVGQGRNIISMSYVENAAAAHVQACDRLAPGSPVAGQAYFINEAEPVLLWEWVNRLLATANVPPLRRRISATAAWAIGGICEGLYGLAGTKTEPPMTRFLAQQLSGSHSYSIQKAQRDFGYSPPVSVEEGLRRLTQDLATRNP